ncbi:extracellular serine proteinase-like [Glandiceps talaboti]
MRFLVFAVLIAVAAAAPFLRVNKPVPNSYIVKLKDSIVPLQFAKQLPALGASVTKVYNNALNGLAVETMNVQKLMFLPGVEYVEEDMFLSIDVEWGMDRTDQRFLPLNGVYNVYGSGSGSHVYIVDTGLRHSHNEYGNRASYFHDYQPSNGGEDCNGHGTHCGGTTSGSSVGTSVSSSLYSVRVLNCVGSGTNANIISGLDDIVARGATASRSVVSMSLGGGANSALDDAVTRVVNAGYTVSVAAGNEDQNACNVSPARHSNALTVGSTTSTDARSSFSNWGNCVDIFAPGSSVRSSWHTCNSCYNTISGTSMACPHVSGIAAVHLGAGQCSSNSSCRNRILNDGTSGVVSNPGVGSPNLLLYCD